MPDVVLQHYSLGASSAELRRLVDLASHEEDRVADACRRAGIGAGATALDVGCGPLGALSALAAIVGISGRVIGIDGSSSALEKARSLLPPESFPQVELLHSNLDQTTVRDIGGGADLAYCRLVLLHQADALASLRRIATLLRPGGTLITHEPSDLSRHAPSSEPYCGAMTRVWELVIEAARARGAQTDFGRNGRRYLEEAGFKLESHRAYAVHYPASIGYEIPRIALQSLRPVLAEHNLASEDEIIRLDQELAAAQASGDVQWVSSPLMFEWIARKPG